MVCNGYATYLIRCSLKLNWPAWWQHPPKFKIELSKFKFESLTLPGSEWNLQVHWRLRPPLPQLRAWMRWSRAALVTSQSQWQVLAASCSPGLWAQHAGATATATGRCPSIYWWSSSSLAGGFAAVSEPHRHGPIPGRNDTCPGWEDTWISIFLSHEFKFWHFVCSRTIGFLPVETTRISSCRYHIWILVRCHLSPCLWGSEVAGLLGSQPATNLNSSK